MTDWTQFVDIYKTLMPNKSKQPQFAVWHNEIVAYEVSIEIQSMIICSFYPTMKQKENKWVEKWGGIQLDGWLRLRQAIQNI